MGKLASLVPAGEEITIGDTKVMFHGLSLKAITELCSTNKEELNEVFSGKKNWMELISKAPDLVAKVIAHGAGEPEDADHIRDKWSAGMQLIALEAVWGATNVNPEILGKIIQGLVSGLEQVAGIVALTSPSTNGSEISKLLPNS